MNKSFTLIEILVVIVVVGILSAFILVGMNSISDSASIAKGKTFANSIRNALLINLVSEWKFDDGSGTQTTTKDYWTTNDGTLTSFNFDATDGWKTGTNCVSGGCLLFDGTNDYINAQNGADFNNLTSFTIELWGKATVNSKDFINKAAVAGNQRSFGFNTNASGYIIMYISPDGINWSGSKVGTVNVINGKWNHIVVVYTGTKIYFYVNGISYEAPTSYSGGVYTSSSPFLMGANYFVGAFSGYMDEIRFYKQGVSFSQIEQNYYSGLNKLFKNNGIALDEFNQRIVELKSNIADNE